MGGISVDMEFLFECSAQVYYPLYILPPKWAIACNSPAVGIRVPQTTQNLVVSRSCLVENDKETYEDL